MIVSKLEVNLYSTEYSVATVAVRSNSGEKVSFSRAKTSY